MSNYAVDSTQKSQLQCPFVATSKALIGSFVAILKAFIGLFVSILKALICSFVTILEVLIGRFLFQLLSTRFKLMVI